MRELTDCIGEEVTIRGNLGILQYDPKYTGSEDGAFLVHGTWKKRVWDKEIDDSEPRYVCDGHNMLDLVVDNNGNIAPRECAWKTEKLYRRAGKVIKDVITFPFRYMQERRLCKIIEEQEELSSSSEGKQK